MFDSHYGFFIENGEDRDADVGESCDITFLKCKHELWYLEKNQSEFFNSKTLIWFSIRLSSDLLNLQAFMWKIQT